MALFSLIAFAAMPVFLNQIPCQDGSDYNALSKLDDGTLCNVLAPYLVPATAAECSVNIGDTPTTKAQMVVYLHSKCCKPGSKPNGVCDSKGGKPTPCQSKAEGEFLPQAK